MKPTAPLKLPKFIFLVGGTDTQAEDICHEVCKSTLSTFAESLLSPLVSAATTLFLNSDWSRLPAESDKLADFPLPLTNRSMATFTDELRDWLRRWYSQDVMGRICLSSLDDDIADNFVITHTTSPHDITPFLKKFGPDECLVLVQFVELHALPQWTKLLPDVHFLIWSDPADAMRLLRLVPDAYAEGISA